jgi:hypothetical protein
MQTEPREIIICCDGSVKLVRAKDQVSVLQLLSPREVEEATRVSPYKDWRTMFDSRKNPR